MKRPWKTLLPHVGVVVRRGRIGWLFWTRRNTWEKLTAYRTLALGDVPPADWRARLLKRMVVGIPKPEPRKGLNSTAPYVDDIPFRNTYPHLASVLLDSTYEDGSHKKPGYITIVPRDRQWSGTVKITGLGVMLRLASGSFAELLQAYDALLSCEAPPWVIDPYHEEEEGKKPRRKSS